MRMRASACMSFWWPTSWGVKRPQHSPINAYGPFANQERNPVKPTRPTPWPCPRIHWEVGRTLKNYDSGILISRSTLLCKVYRILLSKSKAKHGLGVNADERNCKISWTNMETMWNGWRIHSAQRENAGVLVWHVDLDGFDKLRIAFGLGTNCGCGASSCIEMVKKQKRLATH